MPDSDRPDQKVKELLDAATRSELERWFGMPSLERLGEQGKAPAPPPRAEDPEILERRKKRDEALSAVDPAMVEAHRRRTTPPADLIRFKAVIDVRVNPDFAMFDYSLVERQHTVSEPIEREVSEDLRDAMQERTPQALLRDLHRPETNFDKLFEVHDYAAENRVDAVALVAEAMKTRHVLPKSARDQLQDARDLIRALRDDRHRPWIDAIPPNRRREE